jgi:hypothetical protein
MVAGAGFLGIAIVATRAGIHHLKQVQTEILGKGNGEQNETPLTNNFESYNISYLTNVR